MNIEKKQYNYYLNHLLDFSSVSERERERWAPLQEIAIIKRGKRITKKELVKDGFYPVISGGVKPLGYINDFNRNKNIITIAQYGTAGYVDWQEEKFWLHDNSFSIEWKEKNFNNKYLYYVLKNKQEEIYSFVSKIIPSILSLDMIQNLRIPILSVESQNRIVSILDKFNNIISDLSIGLPAEINLRKKQYEYYRSKLLDFSKK